MKKQWIVMLAVAAATAAGAASLSTTSSAQYPVPAPPPAPAPGPVPGPAPLVPQKVTPTMLVTTQMNPDIANAWGLAFNGAAGPAWIADNLTGKSSVYDAANNLQLTVTVPPAAGAMQSRPTGVAFNPNPQAFRGDTFVFVSEDGLVSGWQIANAAAATVRIDNSPTQAVYKGATIATVNNASRLYAANFRAARIDAFDATYAPMVMPAGAFTDPNLPPGYAPFNVKAIGTQVLVAYALQDPTKSVDVPAQGNGFVDAYDLNGAFLARLDSAGLLNAPWGMAITPENFGHIPRRLLVGNFGDGFVQVYTLDPTGLVAKFEGQLGSANGAPLALPGLWALEFAPNIGGFNSQQLYFTEGPNATSGGAYGRFDLLP